MFYKKEFYKENPISFGVFEAILFILLGILLNILFSFINPNNTISYLNETLTEIILGILALILVFRLNLQYDNFLSIKKSTYGLKLGFFIILTGFIQFLIYISLNIKNPINIYMPSLIGGIIFSFAVGFYEETLMRALILKNLVNNFKNRKNGIYKAIIISSLIFGLAHLINITHASLLDTIIQVFYSTTAGILFGSIYIKSENLLSIILLHSIFNLCTYLTANLYYTNFITYSLNTTPQIYIGYNLLLIIGNLIMGIIIINIKKRN